ncbi:PhzF family phenazine biosynthesis protein [Pseudoalteromonas byunsanensis]
MPRYKTRGVSQLKMDIFVVDAFTSQQFKGNSAAVVPVKNWLSDELMQNIAAENNLSETAFIKEIDANKYEIRWFSPLTEIDFCGHATLASAFVLFHEFGVEAQIEFITKAVGSLTVVLNASNEIAMTFPNQKPQSVSSVPKQLLEGLSKKPTEVLINRQAYFAVFANEQDVFDLTYSSEQLRQLAPLDVVVTAPSNEYDFVSRYFWPANGGDEDPVTGSIHAGLAPYWAEKLGRTELIAYQASKRGGVLTCHVADTSIVVSGNGVLYLKGKINV